MARRRQKLVETLIEEGLGLESGHKDGLRHAVHVLADEPMRWFFEESEKEYWNERDEFQNVAPPHDLLWIEFGAPQFIRSEEHGVMPWNPDVWQRAGVLLTAQPRSVMPGRLQETFPDSRWIMQADVFTLDSQGDSALAWTFFYGVEPGGRLDRNAFISFPAGVAKGLTYTVPQEQLQELSRSFLQAVRVAMLTVYFMHAKGTTLRDQPGVSKKVRQKRERRGDAGPKIKFKVLDVGLPARQSLAQAKEAGQGSQRALRMHLRRGGFAVYKPEKPHVSGFVGSMWRSPTVVGQQEEGEIKKEYRVHPSEKPKKRRKRRKKNPAKSDYQVFLANQVSRKAIEAGDAVQYGRHAQAGALINQAETMLNGLVGSQSGDYADKKLLGAYDALNMARFHNSKLAFTPTLENLAAVVSVLGQFTSAWPPR